GRGDLLLLLRSADSPLLSRHVDATLGYRRCPRTERPITQMSERPARILPVIMLSQFAGTALWFAGNAVLGDLQQEWGLAPQALGYVTSAVQLGFISGTLVFAVFALSDVFSPRELFFLSSL